MNDWSGIFYVNYFGCDVFNGGYYNPEDPDPLWRCDNPGARPGFAVMYCMSFVMICSMVMLSMFISTISLSMGESIKGLNEQQRKNKADQRKKKRNQQQLQHQQEVDNPNLTKSIALENEARLLNATLRQVMTNEKVDFVEKMETTWFRRRLVRTGAWARKIKQKHVFKAAMVCAVILSAVVVLWSTYTYTSHRDAIESFQAAIEIFSSFVFSFECVVTILTFEVRPWLYFTSALNNFDFIVLMGSFGFMPGGTQFWMLVRLIRLLLILKLAKSAPGLRIAVGTLICGAASITYVFALLLAVFFIFGNVAYLVFSENDPFHFRNLHIAMVSLFRVSIMDNWIQVLYINLYGCDRYGYAGNPDRQGMCTMPSKRPTVAPLFFMFYILIATFVMLNLFIGVVCIAMEEASALVKAEIDEAEQVKLVTKKHHWTKSQYLKARSVFYMINSDGHGGIELAELEAAVANANIDIPDSELEQAMYAIGGSDMSVNLAEWIQFLIMRKRFAQLKGANGAGSMSLRTKSVLSKYGKKAHATVEKTPKSLDLALKATFAALAKIPAASAGATSAQSLAQFLTTLSDPDWVPFDPSAPVAKAGLPEVVSPVVKTAVQRRKRGDRGQPNLVVVEQMVVSVVEVERQQRPQPAQLAVAVKRRGNRAADMEAQSADADLFSQRVAPGVAQQVFVHHEDLPMHTTLIVADEGIQFASNGDVLLAVRWGQVGFWAPRNQPSVDSAPSMGLLLLGIASLDALREKPWWVQSVIKMEVNDFSLLRPALEQYRPLARYPPAGPTEPMDRLFANGPSCLLFPLPSVWQPDLPEEAAVRACSSGLQLVTATEEQQVLHVWCWEDVAFWRVTPGADGGAMDVLVLGLRIVAGTPPESESAGAMVMFCAEIEETQEALAMLEVYCPSFVAHERSVVAKVSGCFEIAAFEVFNVAELPRVGEYGLVSSQSQLYMHIDTEGVSLYNHEGAWHRGLFPSFLSLVYRWRWNVLSNWAYKTGAVDDLFLKTGEQAMDLFCVEVANEVSARPVLFEAEDGRGIVRRVTAMSPSPVTTAPPGIRVTKVTMI
jgi:voltage-gated sodium channel